MGFEPMTPCLQGKVLSQLSYTPVVFPFARSLEIEQQAKSDASVLAYLSRILLLFLKFRNATTRVRFDVLHRKEGIQPHLPIRLPCYALTPIIEPTFDCCLLAVRTQASGVPNFHGLTGGVQSPGTYSPRHADPRLLAIPTSCRRVAACSLNWDDFYGFCSASRSRCPLFSPL